MRDVLVTLYGVARSLRIYYGDRTRRRAMDALHARFLNPGDLAFDIGAHVGDRIAAFRRLGARVVAVEPQPALLFTLNMLHGRDRNMNPYKEEFATDERCRTLAPKLVTLWRAISAELPDTPYIAAGLKVEERLMFIPDFEALKKVFYPA